MTYGTDLVDGVQLIGATSNWAVMTNTQVDTGRFFTDTEDRRHMNVVFLGADFKDRFFPTTDPIGKTIGIDGTPFEVVGVAKAKGSVFGQSQDNFVDHSGRDLFQNLRIAHGHQLHFPGAGPRPAGAGAGRGPHADPLLPPFAPAAGRYFRDRLLRHAGFGAWDQLTGTIAAAAVGIVSVFMVVGGVVIMNIMLAVVSERTREIGVRKSVGARRQDILNQFLVESSMLSAMGGLIGVTIAWTIAVIVRNFTPVPMDVPLNAVLHRRHAFDRGRAFLRNLSRADGPRGWIRSSR